MEKDYIMNGIERYKALWKAVIVINDAMEKDYIMSVYDCCEILSPVVLLFLRCIIIGLYYFSLKQVNNGKCITAVRGSLEYIPV